MSKIMRLVVLVTALASLLALTSSTAGAVTWHNSGSTSFTAHGTGGTFSASGINLSCTTATMTGVAPAQTVGATYNETGTLTFSPCSMAGTASHYHCNYTFTGLLSDQALAPFTTTGNLDLHCTSKLVANNTNLCTFEGSTPASYRNPSGTTRGQLTLTASNTLKVTNAPPDTCPLGNNVSISLTHQTFTITNGTPTTLGPVLTRTP